MDNFLEFTRHFLADESGPTAAEYSVMLGLIIFVVIVTINTLGNSSSSIWTNDTGKIGAALGSS
ncbi:MAG TPA: Flp family type IVb pilin [Isosphaeraceae bacterium]|nr:Flp family type IVb pilin [Isosphaeraceae bacterium]